MRMTIIATLILFMGCSGVNTMKKEYIMGRQDREHLVLHGSIAIIDAPASLGFALFMELGDELKHRRNPTKYPEGFDKRDFIARAAIPTILLIFGWKGIIFHLL